VFVLEKRQLDKYSKKDRDSIIEAMKKGTHRVTFTNKSIDVYDALFIIRCSTISQDKTSTRTKSSTSIGRVKVCFYSYLCCF
jgi:hypothetical protein